MKRIALGVGTPQGTTVLPDSRAPRAIRFLFQVFCLEGRAFAMSVETSPVTPATSTGLRINLIINDQNGDTWWRPASYLPVVGTFVDPYTGAEDMPVVLDHWYYVERDLVVVQTAGTFIDAEDMLTAGWKFGDGGWE